MDRETDKIKLIDLPQRCKPHKQI